MQDDQEEQHEPDQGEQYGALEDSEEESGMYQEIVINDTICTTFIFLHTL